MSMPPKGSYGRGAVRPERSRADRAGAVGATLVVTPTGGRHGTTVETI